MKLKEKSEVAERNAIHAYLSDDAREGWEVFSEEAGTSITALLEVLGCDLNHELSNQGIPAFRKEWIRLARKVDSRRRKRGNNRALEEYNGE